MADSEQMQSKVFPDAWALRIGAALLLGYLAVCVFGVREKLHRASLEHLSEPTAVGDTAFFPLPRPWDVEKPLATFGGKPLYFADWTSTPDSAMRKAGRADAAAFTVYKFAPAAPEKNASLFLKVNSGVYAMVRPR